MVACLPVSQKLRRQRDQVQSNEMAYQLMTFSICHLLHPLQKYNFQRSADQFFAEIDQLIFGNQILQSLNHVEVNLKLWFLIKSGYYIVPSSSTALLYLLSSLILVLIFHQRLLSMAKLHAIQAFVPKNRTVIIFVEILACFRSCAQNMGDGGVDRTVRDGWQHHLGQIADFSPLLTILVFDV